MPVMLEKLYRALRSANVPEAEATAAAAELAGYESQLAAVRSDLQLLKWMVGTNVAMTIALLFKVFGRG